MNLPYANGPRCSQPELFEALTDYAFGDLDAAMRQRVTRHVSGCIACKGELGRLESPVGAFRYDPATTIAFTRREAMSMVGIAGMLDQSFAGHTWFCVSCAAFFAALHAVPVVVEIAYQFDIFGSSASLAAIVAFAWIWGATLFGLRTAARMAAAGRAGLGAPLLIWAAAAAALTATMWRFLPGSPTVDATFTTWPANLGYMKSVFYAWLVGPLFVMWPFQFVVVMQRELARGRYEAVFRVVAGENTAVAPQGTSRPPVSGLAICLGGLFLLNYVGVNHLFSSLNPAPSANLFRVLVLVRAGLWLLLATIGLWWYFNRVNELKRAAVIAQRWIAFSRPNPDS